MRPQHANCADLYTTSSPADTPQAHSSGLKVMVRGSRFGGTEHSWYGRGVRGSRRGSALDLGGLHPVGFLAAGFQLLTRRQLGMATELLPHGREHLVGEVVLAPGREPLEKRGGEHRCRYADIDRRLDCPATLTRVRHPAGQPFQLGVGVQSRGGQVEQPGGNHRTAAPQFGDLAGVDVELVVLRLFQWCNLSRVLSRADAGIGVMQDVEALREGRHDAVLDAVVHHLHEVARARRTAVQIALLLGRELTVATGGSGDFTGAWRNRLQDRVDYLDRLVIATNHEAVTTLQPEDPTAGTDVDIVNALLAQLGGPADVIAIVRVAAVDDDVAFVEDVGQLLDDFAGDPSGDHHPGNPGLAELVDELLHGDRAGRALTFQLRYEVPIDVEHHTFVPVAHQPANDVRAHSAQPDHSQLHGTSLRRESVKNITEPEVPSIGADGERTKHLRERRQGSAR